MADIEKLLVVEDQEVYRNAARSAFERKIVSTRSTTMRLSRRSPQATWLSLTFSSRRVSRGILEALQAEVLDAIRYGMVKDYIQQNGR